MKKLFLLSTAILAFASASSLPAHSVKANDEVPTYEYLDLATGKKVSAPITGYDSNEVRASKVRLLETHSGAREPFAKFRGNTNTKYEIFDRVEFIDPSFESEFDTKYSNMWSAMSLVVNDKHVVFSPKEFGLYEVDVDRGDGTAYRFKVDVRYNSGAGFPIETYLMGIEIVSTDESDNSSSDAASNASNSSSASNSDVTSSLTSSTSSSASASNSSVDLGLSSTSSTSTSTSAETPATPTWAYSNGRWWYKHANGSYTKNGWDKIDGVWYYFDDEGWMKTGWVKDGKWYYLSESGAMLTGWKKIDNTWYHLNDSGSMETGWSQVNGSWYYLNSSGAMQTGWVKDGGWYYLNNSGAMKTGWLKDKGVWYYLQESGVMKTGWMKVSDKWYYAYNSGELAINTTTPDGYRVNYNGEWV